MTAAAVIIALASSCVFPGEGYAARSNAGGGKIAEVDWGDVGDNVGKTIGTALIGGALSSAWSTAAPINQSTSFFGKLSTDIMNIPQTFGNLLTNTAGNTAIASTPLSAAFSSLTNLETVAPIIIKGYTTYTAGTQVVKAIGMAGQYNEWNPSTTYALSYMGAGMTAGLLNPNAALGKNFNNMKSK